MHPSCATSTLLDPDALHYAILDANQFPLRTRWRGTLLELKYKDQFGRVQEHFAQAWAGKTPISRQSLLQEIELPQTDPFVDIHIEVSGRALIQATDELDLAHGAFLYIEITPHRQAMESPDPDDSDLDIESFSLRSQDTASDDEVISQESRSPSRAGSADAATGDITHGSDESTLRPFAMFLPPLNRGQPTG